MNKYNKALKNRNFALVSFGQWVSNIGSSINFIAITWLTLMLSDAVLSLGILLVLLKIPSIIIGPFAGVIADKYNKKNIIIISDIVRGLLSLLMMFYSNSINMIFLLMLIQTVIDVFFSPAIRSILPQIVDKDELMIANSMSATSSQISRLIGPAIGGVLIGLIGVKLIFLLNGISFLFSALTELFIIYKHILEVKNEELKNTFKEDFNDGLKYIMSHNLVKFVIIFFAVGSIPFGAIHVLNLAYLNKILNLTSEAYGLVMTFYSLGVIIGSITISKINEKFTEIQMMVLGLGFFGIFYILFSIVNFLPVLILMFGICGISSAILNISYGVYLQKYIEPSKLGRVFSIDIALGNTILLIASGLAGIFADYIGIRELMLYCAVLIIIQSIVTSRLNIYKKLNDEVDGAINY